MQFSDVANYSFLKVSKLKHLEVVLKFAAKKEVQVAVYGKPEVFSPK